MRTKLRLQFLPALLLLLLVTTSYGQDTGTTFSMHMENPDHRPRQSDAYDKLYSIEFEVTNTDQEVEAIGFSPDDSRASSSDALFDGTVIIPGTFSRYHAAKVRTNHFSVTSIGASAFLGNNLTSVTIPNSVTSIGDFAFEDNQLTSVTIGNSVETIGVSAFLDNNLTSVTIPNSVTSIGNSAFRYNQLTSVTIGNSVETIGVSAFNDNQLTSVTIGNSVETIADDAFRNSQLTSVTIPNSVTSIGLGAFLGNNLTSVTIGNSVETIADDAFRNNQLTSVTIPNSVTSIGLSAFLDNNLTSVTIGNSVETIRNFAFYDNNLTSVTVHATSPPSLGSNSFTNRGDIDLLVPNGTEAAYEEAGWTGFNYIFTMDNITYDITSSNTVEAISTTNTGAVTIPNTVTNSGNTYTVTSIGNDAFRNKQLTSVEIPESVTYIKYGAFRGNQLTSVTIHDTVTSIGTYAFAGNQLTNVTIPNSVTSIGRYTFQYNQLTSVVIPNSVTRIGEGAFLNNQLTRVTVLATTPPTFSGVDNANITDPFPDRNQIDLIVPNGAIVAYLAVVRWTGFRSITELPEEEIGDEFTVSGITYEITSTDPLEVEAHGYTGNDTAVTIPNTVSNSNTYTVTSIGNDAFRYKGLTSVSITESVTSIGERAFENNTDLTSVNFGTNSNITSIGEYAFVDCALGSVEIPEGMTVIEPATFHNNDEMTHVTIPAGITAIGENSFNSIANLSQVTVLASDPPSVEGNSFGTRSNVDLLLPNGSRADYEANGWTGFRSISELPEEEIGDEFTVSGITYEITSTDPLEVEAHDYDGSDTEITIPNTVSNSNTYTVTSIGNDAFRDKQLTSVEIPESVTYIKYGAFKDNQLTSVTIHDTVTEIGSYAFDGNQLTSIAIPNSVTSIGRYTFRDNQLTNVTIPNSVTSIGEGAFLNNQLTRVTVLATTPPILVSVDNIDVFFTDPNQIDLIVPNGTAAAYEEAAGWTDFGSITELPEEEIGDEFTVSGITYEITSTDPLEVEAHGYTGNDTAVTIPNTVSNSNTNSNTTYTVTSIGNDAFKGKGLTSVSITESVTSIGERAFQNNTDLTSVNFGTNSNITSIGEYAFINCALSSVEIPESVTSIGEHAFENNKDLTSVNFGTNSNITSIGERAFIDCALGSVEIPEGMTVIEPATFHNNDEMTHVTIPAGITAIGENSFNSIANLSQVTVLASNPPSVEGNSFGTRSNVDLLLPNGSGADYEANGWTGFKSISSFFTTQDGIEYIVTSPIDPYTVEAISYTGSATSVNIPNTVTNSGNTYTVTSIGNDAFRNKQLTSVEIPESVTYIKYGAFKDNQFTSVTIPINVTEIGSYAFDGNQLTSVAIPNSVTSIGRYTFRDNQLTNVTIPNSVTEIGEAAFLDNPLTRVTVLVRTPPTFFGVNNPNNPDPFPDRGDIDLFVPNGAIVAYLAVARWTGFRSISELPEGEIGDEFTVSGITYEITSTDPLEVEAHGYDGSDTEITIPNTVTNSGNTYTVTSIGDNAFRDKGLTSVSITESVTSIGERAFENNKDLTSVNFGTNSNITSIGERAFIDCALGSVEIPEGMTVIEPATFHNNDEMTHVTIPAGITAIGENSFNSIANLSQVTVLASNPPSVEGNSFGTRSNVDLLLPNGSRADYEANGWTGFRSTTEGQQIGDEFTVSGITYEITSTDPLEVEAHDYTGNDTAVTIPNTVSNSNTYTVTSIGDNAFRDKQLTSVEIPESVTYIKFGAFKDNQLTSIAIHDTVTNIGSYAFDGNQLTSIAIPNSVTSIGRYTFRDNQLTNVTIPNSVTEIGEAAFLDNPLTRVTVLVRTPPTFFGVNNPNNPDPFPDRGDIDLFVPNGAIVAYLAVARWTGFRSISELPEEEIGDEFTVSGITYEITSTDPLEVEAHGYDGSDTEITIPNTVSNSNTYTVTSIGNDAFKGKGLTSVSITESVTSIGERAFENNKDLTSVNFGTNSNITSIGERAFIDCALGSVEIPEGMTVIEPATFHNNDEMTHVTIPAGITAIGENSFNSIANLSQVTVLASNPPSVEGNSFGTLSTRSNVDLFVPNGTEAAYEAAGWTGFRSILVPFTTTWEVGNADYGDGDLTVTIPTTGSGYNYIVDWGDGNVEPGFTANAEHTYTTAGTYTIKIYGDFPMIFFNNGSATDKNKLLFVNAWGDIEWQNMSRAFYGCTHLDVTAPDAPNLENVTNMHAMFNGTSLTGTATNLNSWNVANVEDMGNMFNGASVFNPTDISAWNVGKVTSMYQMFFGASSFDADISGWDVGQVTTMYSMFTGASAFNADISGWDVGEVTTMHQMFNGASSFQGVNIGTWGSKTSKVTNMGGMFNDATSFNADISGWEVGEVTNMVGMFQGATTFNNGGEPMNWGDKTANVTDMVAMFNGASSFDADISGWDVGQVTTMRFMFNNAEAFNQDISGWYVEKVENMEFMFSGASDFDQDISGWDVSSVTTMAYMFASVTETTFNSSTGRWDFITVVPSSFNQDLSKWADKTSNVTDMYAMFYEAENFDQDIGDWDIGSVTDMALMLDNSGLSATNYNATLEGWANASNTPTAITLGAGGLEYDCDGKAYRDILTSSPNNWTILNDTDVCSLSINNEVFSNTISVSPNPVTSVLTINGPAGFELKQATVYTIMGKQLLSTTSTTLNTSSLSSGLYLLKIENTEGQIAIKKIVKQ